MYKKVFIDANVFIDKYDIKRDINMFAKDIFQYLVGINSELYTSCDLITTIYYIISKIDKNLALDVVENINTICEIIEFSNKDISTTCALMKENSAFKDFEDSLQYVLAKKVGCDLILSNDKNFFSPEIELLSTKELAKKLKL